MPDSGSPVDAVQIGDCVAYKLSSGEPVCRIRGKVLGLFNTHYGQTMADVEWEQLGPPRRLNIDNLTKA